jgi:hypothetical protein
MRNDYSFYAPVYFMVPDQDSGGEINKNGVLEANALKNIYWFLIA